jgi:ribosomal protein S18 acetylase RimI-like enzyme
MQAKFNTRSFRTEDYDAVLRLWEQSEGVEVAEGDDRAGIASYLARNPNLSRIAEVDGVIAGAVLCGHDGRRGLIYHLAVASTARGQGIGRKLVGECIDGLKACGIKRALMLVAQDNGDGREFWLKLGFEEISGASAFGIDIE